MVRRSRLCTALVTLTAVLLVGAYTAPAASAAGLRAAKCCAERCDKPRSPDAARHCCPSLAAAGAVGAFTVPAKAAPLNAGFALLLPVASELPRPASLSHSPAVRDASPRAAPLFLRTLSLRL